MNFRCTDLGDGTMACGTADPTELEAAAREGALTDTIVHPPYVTKLDPISGQWATYSNLENKFLGRYGRGDDAREDCERHTARMVRDHRARGRGQESPRGG